MCLYSRQILPRRATKDIVCYKVMYKEIEIESREISYVSPSQGFVVPAASFGKKYKAMGNYKNYQHKMVVDNIVDAVHGKWHRETLVTEGYFHAYKSDKDAIYFRCRGCVIKCRIPKGALYWNGTEGDICATEMIFVETICTQRQFG